MKINLEDFVGKKVKVTLTDGRIYEGIVKFFSGEGKSKKFFIRSSNYDLVDFDQEGNNRYHPHSNIIHIEELPMNTNEILNEINKTKVQLHLLEEKLKEAEKQEKFNSEYKTPIENNSDYEYCLKFLKTKDVKYISGCFDWSKPPQGVRYWNDVVTKNKSLDKSDIQQIKDWVINYLIKKDL